MKHGTELEPNTYSRGSGRIDFTLCSKTLLPFISNAGILPFGMIVFSDHWGLFIDINLHQFLRNPNTYLVTNYLRTLISSHPKRVLKYKKKMQLFITKRNVQTKIEDINQLMKNKKLTAAHMSEINNIDKTVTIGMISSGNKLIKIVYDSPWSLKLDRRIKHSIYWRLVKS